MSRSFKQNGSNSSEESLNDSDQVPDQVQLYKNKKFTQKSSVGTQSERNPLDDRRTRSTLDSRELGVEVSPLVDLTRVDRPHSVNCITAKRQTVDVEREFQRQTSYEEPAVSWRNIKRSTASGASGSQGGTYRHSPVSGPSTSMTIFQSPGMSPAEAESTALLWSREDSNFSRSSGYPFRFENQESRPRLSNEQNAALEDYQSYDYQNATGRQEIAPENAQRETSCCALKKSRSMSSNSSRPVPITVEPQTLVKQDSVTCRICHESEEIEPLIQPCLCKGTVGNIHAKCLKKWLEQSNTNRCELCAYSYAIRQTRKYKKCYSVKVFFQTVIDRRALAYDIISFVVITPLTFVGIAMCIRSSIIGPIDSNLPDATVHMGNVTRAGMIMLSITIIIAYTIWLYTVMAYHYKTWKRWYENCYDVEVIPIRMTSEERMEAEQRVRMENQRRRAAGRERGSTLYAALHGTNPQPYTFYQRQTGSFMTSVRAPAHR